MAYTDIDKPSDYFNTKLYSGNASTQSITGVGFQPDFTWIKQRNGTGWHQWVDAVRGSGKRINSNDTGAEYNDVNGLTSFDTDGFSLGTSGDYNGSGNTQVSWNWLASNTTASNTDGSITSTVSANTTSGFSIVSYTGTGSNATVGHGLGVVPKMIIVKLRSGAGDWTVYNSNIGNTNFLRLNGTLASTSQATYWNNTTPTSSVFSIGSAGDVNTSSGTHIAYCFAEKKGFSKFGSYTGNGSTDGPFIYTGFKPALTITKRTSDIEHWGMYDSTRDTFNPASAELIPNLNASEGSFVDRDFLSNGFKIRSDNTARNGSGDTYIYMAFAENPFVTSTGIPTTAR
jgi:hypothetical protein